MTTALPELWTDWCTVAGVPDFRLDEPTLTLFSRQADPPKAVLASLRRLLAPEPQTAPAWPRRRRDDPNSLQRLIQRATAIIQHPDTHWVFRLRLRRMLFAAVLLAPPSHGGLGLDRSGALRLPPDAMNRVRGQIGVTPEPDACPACVTWSWLDVLGTNYGWSHGSVRALGHRRDEEGPAHRHLRPDPNPDWHLCVGMLPAVDRWGWIDPYHSMHPSSLSAVISAAALLLDGPEPAPGPGPAAAAMQASLRRQMSREEEEQVLKRADELTARVEAILREFDNGR
ncbi:hypothetical protein DC347_19605 [Pseudarthrobacter sp. AG30]|uniref:hypothetical protein n=1 Tax=unclassified Pseudarthrobacter TaxID=2647000 RepID=UPI000D6E8A79|nr:MULTISPECIES: hypothetical protein [unclassified Pseudarthrobacter]QDG63830.1 hypothetical protein NIBR502771_16945 [Pseudarthrobacter sp. NIBRBAC000502771]RAX15027.1 hypothetical protein DC347_19605 [Pseudarthrobacter sp. AG30]